MVLWGGASLSVRLGKPVKQDGVTFFIYFNIFFSGKGDGRMNQFVPQRACCPCADHAPTTCRPCANAAAG